MSGKRVFDVGPGFVRAKECPDCFHTRCGDDCVCNCDAARAEYEAAFHLASLEQVHWLRFCEAWVAIGLAATQVEDMQVWAGLTEKRSRGNVASACGYSTEGAT